MYYSHFVAYYVKYILIKASAKVVKKPEIYPFRAVKNVNMSDNNKLFQFKLAVRPTFTYLRHKNMEIKHLQITAEGLQTGNPLGGMFGRANIRQLSQKGRKLSSRQCL